MYRYPPGFLACLVSLLVASAAGCGVIGNGGTASTSLMAPVSNAHAAKRALDDAAVKLGLSGMEGYPVTVEPSRTGDIDETAAALVRDYLVNAGVRVAGSDDGSVTISVRVDTLRVVLDRGQGKYSGYIVRSASAAIVAEAEGPGAVRRVFRADGEWRDSFDPIYRRTIDTGLTYVEDRSETGSWKNRIKPALVAVTATVFAWMLYSYRG